MLHTLRRARVGLALAAAFAGFVAMPVARTGVLHAQDDDQSDVLDHPRFVNEKTEKAIERGCAWLARHQKRSGEILSDNSGYGSGYPVAMTSLAGMAWLSHGDTPTKGKYARNVRSAIEFLLRCSKNGSPRGFICSPGENSIHAHGFAMLFLAECLGSDADPELEQRIKDALKHAIDITNKSQSDMGGWYYTPEKGNDEGSTTITQVQALRACRNAGIAVPASVIKKAVKYIEKSVCPDGGIAYTARNGGSGSCAAITAAAVAVLYDAGEYDSPIAKKALSYCKSHINVNDGGAAGGHYFYAHLYLAQANWQAGGRHWEDYYPKIRDVLCTRQQGDGSWDGDGVGRVYGTAIATTILAIPYEHVPIYAR
jgi:hypothetical protein